MNVLKIQQELLKAMVVDPSKVKCVDRFDDWVSLTIDGSLVWNIPREWLRLNLEGTQESAVVFPTEDVVITPDNQLKATDNYRVGGTARQYLRTDDPIEQEVYVDTGKLKFFTNPTLYQHPEWPYLLYITEDLYNNGDPVWVGTVCPIKVKDED